MQGYANDKKRWRLGFTTGAAAAAAAAAATQMLYGGTPPPVWHLKNLEGQEIAVPIESVEKGRDEEGYWGRAVVIKDGGDDPDVTHGLPVVVTARPASEGVELLGGEGVGRVTRPGLAVPVGQPAINPVPCQMIRQAVAAVLPPGKGVRLVIAVPGGEKVAERTLNPRLGIVGGISILGTTGIVRPMSEDAYRRSLLPQVDVAYALGLRELVLTPGGLGRRWALAAGLRAEAVVETSNFIGYLLEYCAERGVQGVLLWGHCSKLAKVAAGCFNTHSRLADGRREVLAALAALCGAPQLLVGEILAANTVEAAIDLLLSAGYNRVFTLVAERASQRAREYVGERLEVGTVLLNMRGHVLGYDTAGRQLGRRLGWAG